MSSKAPDDQVRLDYLMQVGHALNLICELPEWLERAPLPKHLRHAAEESFAMNGRVLVEFLWSSGWKGDIRACDYCGNGWLDGEKPAEISWLGDKHVAHMTSARSDEPLVVLTYEQRCAIRDRLLSTAEQFVAAIVDEACAERMAGFVEHARTLGTWPPPPTAGEDPAPFIGAFAHLSREPRQTD